MNKRILIVGGGFAGVKAALELAEQPEFEVTLLSDNPNFEYHPTLYKTATGARRAIASLPLLEIFSEKNINIVQGVATKLDRSKKQIITDGGGVYGYDELILALGNTTNYFGVKGLAEYSYGIKTIRDAEELKDHLHKQMLQDHKPDPHYIIVGAGPTGVELAGALPNYIRSIMKEHGIKPRKIHVDLIEAAPRLMPRMPKSVSRALARRLKNLGVKLYLGKTVQAETAEELLVDGKPIRSHTVIWTAGVANHPFFAANNFMHAKNGKVQVDKYLRAWPHIYVIGDNADTKYSGMAQTALHNAQYVAKTIIAKSHHQKTKPYKPKKPVCVTPVGSNWATVVWGPLHFYGWLGWVFRQVADWIGYNDVEPWWKATELILAQEDREDSCVLCAKNTV